MSDLERARAAANAALLKLMEEIGFAIYHVAKVGHKEPPYHFHIADQAVGVDAAIDELFAIDKALCEQRANIRAAADRIAEATDAALRG